jgi:hypothetical protein
MLRTAWGVLRTIVISAILAGALLYFFPTVFQVRPLY